MIVEHRSVKFDKYLINIFYIFFFFEYYYSENN